jgi:hypothetical protein
VFALPTTMTEGRFIHLRGAESEARRNQPRGQPNSRTARAALQERRCPTCVVARFSPGISHSWRKNVLLVVGTARCAVPAHGRRGTACAQDRASEASTRCPVSGSRRLDICAPDGRVRIRRRQMWYGRKAIESRTGYGHQ